MKRSYRMFYVAGSIILIFLSLQLKAQYNEKYRAQYHFSPNSNWIGDPSAMIKWKGKYHLYWWSHASSSDLVHWKSYPYPIIGDPGIYSINTGSAVVDKNNVAGFGANSIIAFHTLAAGAIQGVGISSSIDSGFNYNLFNGNPVLGPLSNDNFRDPQVFWYAPTNKWILAIARGHERRISFYSSDSLKKNWQWLSDFGPFGADNGDNWETPDLFPLPVDGNTNNMKWVLLVGVYPRSGDTVRQTYHIGSFDGINFNGNGSDVEYRMDAGRDFYAARTWRDYDQTNPASQSQWTALGWMGSWSYADKAPSQFTYRGRGVMSLPRDLALKSFSEGIRLVQTPIIALQNLRNSRVDFGLNKTISGSKNIIQYGPFSPSKNTYEFDVTFSVNPAATFGVNVCVDSIANRRVIIKYDAPSQTLSIDRSSSSDVFLNNMFLVPAFAKVAPENNKIRLHVFVDQSSVEVFTNQGKVVMSMLTYPGTSQLGIELFSNNSTTTMDSFTGWQLNSIWNPADGYQTKHQMVYKIKNRGTGKFLDSPSEDPNNGGWLQQWSDASGTNQQWRLDSLDAYTWKITNIATNKVIDLEGGSSANGAKIQQYDWSNNVNQKWEILDLGGGFYKIMNQQNRKVIEVEGGLAANGHKIQQWSFVGYKHQQWELIPISTSPRPLKDTKVLLKAYVNENKAFTVFPNPVHINSVRVQSKDNNIGGKRLINEIVIFSSNGAKIKSISNLKGMSSFDVNISLLSKNFYFLKIYDGKKWESHKLEIQ